MSGYCGVALLPLTPHAEISFKAVYAFMLENTQPTDGKTALNIEDIDYMGSTYIVFSSSPRRTVSLGLGTEVFDNDLRRERVYPSAGYFDQVDIEYHDFSTDSSFKPTLLNWSYEQWQHEVNVRYQEMKLLVLTLARHYRIVEMDFTDYDTEYAFTHALLLEQLFDGYPPLRQSTKPAWWARWGLKKSFQPDNTPVLEDYVNALSDYGPFLWMLALNKQSIDPRVMRHLGEKYIIEEHEDAWLLFWRHHTKTRMPHFIPQWWADWETVEKVRKHGSV